MKLPARTKAGTAGSEYVALKQIGKERKLDLTQYFPASAWKAR